MELCDDGGFRGRVLADERDDSEVADVEGRSRGFIALSIGLSIGL